MNRSFVPDPALAAIFGELGMRFPAQANPDRSILYIKDLEKHHFEIEDVREGAKRVIATREQATFPPFAVVLRACHAARADRTSGQFADRIEADYVPPPVAYDLTPVRGVRNTSPGYRDQAWWDANPNQPAGVTLKCGPREWVKWNEDTRPWAQAEAEHTSHRTRSRKATRKGVPPLTQKEIDMLNRRKREREQPPEKSDEGYPF